MTFCLAAVTASNNVPDIQRTLDIIDNKVLYEHTKNVLHGTARSIDRDHFVVVSCGFAVAIGAVFLS